MQRHALVFEPVLPLTNKCGRASSRWVRFTSFLPVNTTNYTLFLPSLSLPETFFSCSPSFPTSSFVRTVEPAYKGSREPRFWPYPYVEKPLTPGYIYQCNYPCLMHKQGKK